MISTIAQILAAVSIAVPGDTSAATAEAGPEAEPADTTLLQEVSVTAVKQTDRLLELPVASTVTGRAEIERLGVTGIKGISDVVPNFYMPEYGSRITSSIYVRGIGARMDQPAVGLTVDNVPILNKDAYDFDIPDMAEVVMLRGPQSTLYGRNTIGGQINVTTISPMRWEGWRFMAEAANGLTFRINAGWYHRFSRKAGMSATAAFTSSRGFFRNAYNNSHTDKERSGSIRVKAHYNPSTRVTIQNVLSTSVLRQGGYPYEYTGTGEISYNDTCFYRRFLLSDGLTVRGRLDRVELTSITTYQYIDDNMTLDQDFLPLPYFTLTQKKRESALTEDLIAKGTNTDIPYRWTAGFSGFYKHLRMQAPVTFKDTGIATLIENNRNDANPDYPIRWDERQFVLGSRFTIPTWGVSFYHESRLELGRWHLGAGLRLDYEHTSMDYISQLSTSYTVYHSPSSGATPELFNHVPIDIDDSGRLSRHFLTLIPKVTALFDVADGCNVYANVSKGYKAGGFNTQMFSDVLQQRLMTQMGIGSRYDINDIVGYRPEKSWNFEIGSHLEFIDGRLGIEASLFYIDCHDQQLTMFPDGTTTGRIMTNAGKTRSLGGELSVRADVGGGVTLTGSYGYTDAKFRKFFNGITSFDGKFLPYVPRNTLFAQALWKLPLKRGGWTMVFDLNVRATGKIYWNEANTLSQPLYAQLGASAALANDKLEIQLWGRNLTDTRYHTFYFMSMGNEFLQRGKPIQAGVTVRLNINNRNNKNYR